MKNESRNKHTQNGGELKKTVRSLLPAAVLLILSGGGLCSAFAGQLTLSWNDNSDNEDGFKIERSFDGASYAEIGTTGADVSTYVDSSVVDDQDYTYRVKAYNLYGDSGYSNIATGLYESPNSPPMITSIQDQSFLEDGSASGLAFTISDAETSSSALTVEAISSNVSLLPNSAFVLAGTQSSRNLSLTPIPGAYGSTIVTVSVSDGQDTTTSQFTVFVQSVTDPTITAIDSQVVEQGTSFQSIPFAIGDQETAADQLSISIASSNQGLVPSSNITLSGTGSNRSLSVSPVLNTLGNSTLTITIGDGTAYITQSFDLTVYSAPSILTQPEHTDTMLGDSTTLSINVEAYPPPSYQWYVNGSPIQGATNAQLSFAETLFSHEGLYKVQIINTYGSVTSQEAVLNVDQIINSPSGLQITAISL